MKKIQHKIKEKKMAEKLKIVFNREKSQCLPSTGEVKINIRQTLFSRVINVEVRGFICSVSRTMTHHHPRLTTTLASLTSHTHARTLRTLQEKRQSTAFGRFETVSRKRESIETTTLHLM